MFAIAARAGVQLEELPTGDVDLPQLGGSDIAHRGLAIRETINLRLGICRDARRRGIQHKSCGKRSMVTDLS